MAITHYPYPGTKDEPKVSYEGKVVSTYSDGTYHDDYYYAVVYELDASGTPDYSDVMYHTTAFATNGGAVVDAPQWVVDHYREKVRKAREAEAERKRKADVYRGAQVQVVRGRKIPKGTTAKVFWMGSTRFGTSVGLELPSGDRLFTAKYNVEVI
jgi:hypothetical protein